MYRGLRVILDGAVFPGFPGPRAGRDVALDVLRLPEAASASMAAGGARQQVE